MAGLYVLQWIGSTHEANNSFTLSGRLRPQRTVRWACWWWTPGGSQSQHLALTHEKSCTDLNHCSIVCVSISLCVSVFICVFVCVRLGALHRAMALFQSAGCLQPSHLKMGIHAKQTGRQHHLCPFGYDLHCPLFGHSGCFWHGSLFPMSCTTLDPGQK